jgi:hypothetical protein
MDSLLTCSLSGLPPSPLGSCGYVLHCIDCGLRHLWVLWCNLRSDVLRSRGDVFTPFGRGVAVALLRSAGFTGLCILLVRGLTSAEDPLFDAGSTTKLKITMVSLRSIITCGHLHHPLTCGYAAWGGPPSPMEML